MQIKYLGHSCFLIQTGGKELLIDPFISPNVLASEINIDTLRPDYILLTHGHEDHVADAEVIAKNSGAKIISSFEIFSWFQKKEIAGHPMNLGGKWSFDFGTVKYVSAIHSSMMPDGSYGGPAGGFVVWNEETSFYVAGDTALTMDMKLIPMTCPPLKFAILPVGDNFTMGVDDALIASSFVECDTVIGCHFDTFGFVKIEKKEAIETFKNAGKSLILPEIGKYFEV